MKKTFQDRELEILRHAVDNATEKVGRRTVKSPDVQNIIKIVEDFLKREHCICYGGTAINNILPEQDKFYNKNVELPDYDFFSPKALEHAKQLADLYYKSGYQEVEAKAGIHYGTFKVFVNYIPVADITQIDVKIYRAIKSEAIKVNNIYYSPPNYLRMAMYLELSRPEGDVSRWEKVLKRLVLLNKNYPLTGLNCNIEAFMREFEGDAEIENRVYDIVKNSFIDQGLIFFGGYASTLYGKYMPRYEKRNLEAIPDFDLLSEDPLTSCTIVKERLERADIPNVKIINHKQIGEIIPEHYEIRIGDDTIAFIYKPNACHSYNTININGRNIKVATIDTMLSFYLAFMYADKPYYDKNRLLCMSEYLFKVQSRNRLQQKGLLKRFSINCYGNQKSMEDIRSGKSDMYKKLSGNKNSRDYQYYFLRYIPSEINTKGSKQSKTNKRVKRDKRDKKSIKQRVTTHRIQKYKYKLSRRKKEKRNR